MKFTFPPESKPLPGLTIKRAIHRGGFGEVYYGLTDAGKEVALKLLHQHTDVELRGATACLNLNHPNLVSIYDIKTDADGDHWVVMEYVGGQRLADVLDERQKLPVEEIERWLDGMAAGLIFLHDRGIVHRDLKPSNVFSENGIVKVGDVGLSKFISESRRSAHTQSVGTVYYMAPEVARGRYGREVDVYALGIMIYEMFTGDVPFDGESSGEILMKHLSERPNLEKLPVALRPVIARALEKDPTKRTSTVARLRDEFKAAVRGRTYDSRPAGIDEEPEDLREDSFIDAPRQHAGHRQSANEQERARFAAAQRAAEHAWQAHRHAYQDRAAVARAFGPGPRGCGPGNRDRHGSCPGSLVSEVKRRPWLILIAVVLFLIFTRAGRGMLPGIMELAVFGAVAGAYLYLVVTLFRYFTGRQSGASAAPVHVPVNAGKPPQQTAARQFVAAPAVARRSVPRPAVPTPESRRKISARSRASQLSGALTIAPLVTAILTVAIAYMGFLPATPEIVFFGGSTLLASWLMLSANKLVEGSAIDVPHRRLLQAGVGAGVGGGIWLLHDFLLHRFASGEVGFAPVGLFSRIGSVELLDAAGPNLFGFMIFFAVLMLSGLWWNASDSYRKKRFSVWRTCLAGLIGFAASALFPVPIAWGVVWAVTIFSVVQLSAPWTPPEERVASGNS